MELSPEQIAVSDFCKNEKRNLLCICGPGSGKTTTLLHCVVPSVESKSEKILVLMFSKSIQLEFAAKAKQLGLKCTISTYHSVGHGMLTSHFRSTYDQEKLKKIGKKLGVRKYDIYKLVSLAKTEGIGIIEPQGISSFNKICDDYSLDLSSPEVKQAIQVFDLSNADTKTFDYDDMVYAPVFHKLSNLKYEVILNDEYQDISKLRFEFLKRCFNQDARFIMVGDPNQSIFAWNGTDAGITAKLKKEFNAETLPLSVTWRCSRIVTEECNRIFPGMSARPGAPLGSKTYLSLSEFEQEDFSLDCFILCRVNAPLVKIAFSLQSRNFNCRVQGREIGLELVNFCKKWKWEEFPELRDKLETYLNKQKIKLLPDNKKQFKSLEDKFEIINLMMDKCERLKKNTKEQLFDFICKLFQDEGDGIVLSTPYKVKGLERKDVYLYGSDVFFPPPWVSGTEELEEEERVKYVAISRAKENIYYVSIGKNDKSPYIPKKGPGKTKADFLKIPANADEMDF